VEEKEKIEALVIVPSWKEKFLAIAETKPIGGGWAPEFGDKAKYKALPFWTKYSVYGLLFSIFFYLSKGMWKKAILIVVAYTIVQQVAISLDSVPLFFGSIILGVLIPTINGNIDYYRKVVLGEDFWW